MESAAGHPRSIGMDALFQYTGTGVQLFSGMIFYLIIVRLFSPESVGAIALFLAIIGLFQVVFTFGLSTAAQHFTSYSIGKGDYASAAKVFYKIIGYGFTVSIAGFISLVAMSPYISILFLHSSSYSGLVRLLSIVLLGNILFGILNGTLLGLQNFRLSAMINIVIWIVYYFGSVFLASVIHDLNSLVMGWTIGIFTGVAIELIAILRLISRYKGKGSSVPGHVLFKYSTPVVLSGLISYGAAYADRFIVAGLLNLSSLGVYNFALLIGSSIGFIAIPFNNILMPKFSELFGNGRRDIISSHVKASSLLLSSLYVPAALGISALAPMIIDLLGGPEYSGGAAPLTIIMVLSALFITSNVLTQAVASVRRTKIFIYSSIAAFAANIGFSYALIPRYGLVGAAFGISSVYAATFFVLLYFSMKEGVSSYDIFGNIKVWISSIVMFFIVSFEVMTFGHDLALLPVYVVSGASVYLALSRVLRLFKSENRELVLSLFPDNYTTIRKFVSIFILH